MPHSRAVSLHPSTTSADHLKNWRSYEIQIPAGYPYPTVNSDLGLVLKIGTAVWDH